MFPTFPAQPLSAQRPGTSCYFDSFYLSEWFDE